MNIRRIDSNVHKLFLYSQFSTKGQGGWGPKTVTNLVMDRGPRMFAETSPPFYLHLETKRIIRKEKGTRRLIVPGRAALCFPPQLRGTNEGSVVNLEQPGRWLVFSSFSKIGIIFPRKNLEPPLNDDSMDAGVGGWKRFQRYSFTRSRERKDEKDGRKGFVPPSRLSYYTVVRSTTLPRSTFPSLVRPNSMEARPQKRLRINAPLLLPSLLLARPCSRTPGADYNYRAFCFAIRGSPSPVKFRLFFNPLPCVEFRVHPP